MKTRHVGENGENGCTTMKGKTYVVVFSNKTFDVVNHIIVIHRKGKDRIYWKFLS